MHKFVIPIKAGSYLKMVEYANGERLTGLDLWCDSCDHVYSDPQNVLISGVYKETDGYGPVVRALYCAQCVDSADMLSCEWCNQLDSTVDSKRSYDSGDYYSICDSCNRAHNRPPSDEDDDWSGSDD